ncbi:glycoside hydrolase family 2 TIM barrel-domain containing protein [Nocardia fluminea]|uniref:glycoside hydrolase family 2 TIM barrel-domain containing protein n=1 Tax=Nocardia fluminea TaxID=134984 RepID=UPI00340ECE4A
MMQLARPTWNDGWTFRRRVSVFDELGGASGEWRATTLPHDALIAEQRTPDAPGAHAYFGGGAFEYRKTFTPPTEDSGKRVLLELGGVYRDSMVFVNGALAGQWPFGYSRFSVRLDPYLRFGEENEVRVECRSHLDSRWYAGAGIHRDVFLIVKPPVHITHDGVTVTTPDIDDDLALVEVAVDVTNAATTTVTRRAVVRLVGPDGREVATGSNPVTLHAGESGTTRLRLPVDSPARWNMDAPFLYTACVELRPVAVDDTAEIDVEDVTFGIRTLQVDARRGLRVNGKPVLLRGACVHADNGPLGAVSVRRAEERRVQLLKAAGFNAVRMSHHPASPALLEACDRLGMLVMDETWDMWTSGKTDFDSATAFSQWWERDVAALVAKDRNHPSVIMYSIGNEIPELGSPDGGRWSRLVAEKVRELDPTRFVTNGVNGFVAAIDMVLAGMSQRREAIADAAKAGQGVNGMMAQIADQMNMIAAAPQVTARTEESVAALDVAGFNYGDGRYEMDGQQFPDRIIVGTETFPTRIAHNWQLVKRLPHVIGDFTWTGWDYLGEAGIGLVSYADQDGVVAPTVSQPYPALTANTGDLDITGMRRPVSYYREIVFGLRTEPYLVVQRPEHYGKTQLRSPWAWSDSVASWTWEGFEGAPVTVEVYADADLVELVLDGDPIGRATVGEELPFLASLDATYRPGEIVAVAYRDGTEVGRTALRTAGKDLVITVTPDRSVIGVNVGDLAYVAIALTDRTGIVHTTFDRTVAVTVEGPGELLGLGSGRPVTEEPFSGAAHRTFDGRALAIVRPTGPGDITITVAAEGCEPTSARLTATSEKNEHLQKSHRERITE